MANTAALDAEIAKLQYSGGDQVGDVLFLGDHQFIPLIKAASAITRGQVVQLNKTNNNWEVSTTVDADSNWVVAWDTTGAADTRFVAWDKRDGYVNLLLQGTAAPYADLMLSGTTAGAVRAWVPGTDPESARIGRYYGHPRTGEIGDGVKAITAGADGDVIYVKWKDSAA